MGISGVKRYPALPMLNQEPVRATKSELSMASAGMLKTRRTASSSDVFFAGMRDEVRQNRDAMDLARQKDMLDKRLQTLKNTLLNVGNRQFTGLELLQFLYEHKKNLANGWVPTANVHDDLYLKGSNQYGQLRNALNALVGLELVSNWENRHEHWNLTVLGENLLKKLGENAHAHPSQIHAALESQMEPGKLAELTAATQAPPRTITEIKRLEKIKILLSSGAAGITGWQLMTKLQAQDNSRSMWARLFTKGMKEKDILLNLPAYEAKAIRQQLTELARVGMIVNSAASCKQGQENPHWVLTSEAHQLLKQSNPSEALGVVETDIKNILLDELDRLEKEKNDKLGQIKKLNDLCDKEQKSLDEMLAKLKKDELEALAVYRKAMDTENPKEKETLEEDASEKALRAELLKKQIELKSEVVTQLKANLDTMVTYQRAWNRQAHQKKQKLMESQIRMESANLFKNVLDIMKDIQKIEEEQRNAETDDKTSPLTEILNVVHDDYYTFQAAVSADKEKKAVLKETKVGQDFDLAHTMEALEAKHQAEKAAAQAEQHTNPDQSPLDAIAQKTKSEKSASKK